MIRTPKEWYCKYLERITHRKIMDFIGMTKNLGNYEVSPKIFDSPDKDKTVLDICEDLSRILNLPLCTVFHQIVRPKCVDCKHSRVTWYHLPLMPPYPTSPVEQKTAHTMSIFEFHEPCPYHTFITHTIYQPFEKYIPPQGCDCWRPK